MILKIKNCNILKYGIIVISIICVFKSYLYSEIITLPELEKKVLSNNQNIKAMEHEANAMLAMSESADAPPDPQLKFGVNNLPVKDPNFRMDNMTSKEIGVSQMLPLGGKLGSKKTIAYYEYLRMSQLLKKMRLETVSMIRMKYYHLCFIREAIPILEEIKNSIKMIIEGEIAAQKSGMGSLSGVVKANLEYSMMNEEIIILKQEESEALNDIIYLAGGDSAYEVDTRDGLAVEFKSILEDETAAKVLSGNPEILLIKLAMEKSAEEKSLAKKEYIPDLELGLSYMQRDDGPMGKRDDMVSFMASINVPVWSAWKNSKMVQSSDNKVQSAEQSIIDKKNLLLKETKTLLSNLKKWEALYNLYMNQLIPQSQLAFETFLARYNTGRSEFMALIDTQRMLLRYRKEALMARKEYLAGMAKLNELMGIENEK